MIVHHNLLAPYEGDHDVDEEVEVNQVREIPDLTFEEFMGAYGGTGKARHGVTIEEKRDLLALPDDYSLAHTIPASIKDARGRLDREYSSKISEVGEASAKCKTRVHLSDDAKEIIRNVYQTLKEDNPNPEDGKFLIKTTSRLTRMPYTTVWKIVTNRIQPRKKRSDFSTHKAVNEKDAEVIRRAIYNFYSKNLVPTLSMIYDQLVKDYSITYLPSTLSRFLNHIGFRYKKINKRSSIMDSPRLIKWRNEYLDAISKFRDEGRPIFYLDETWFDTHDTAQKGWTDDSIKCAPNYPINRGQRINILNIGSKTGWLGGDSFLLSPQLAVAYNHHIAKVQ
uniref:Uncharacterized protein LOC114337827 n=1 Tax=Diabrotica virgifera virgifera TaxID=50390 RepID=A0A6P7GGG4_DIAVI